MIDFQSFVELDSTSSPIYKSSELIRYVLHREDSDHAAVEWAVSYYKFFSLWLEFGLKCLSLTL